MKYIAKIIAIVCLITTAAFTLFAQNESQEIKTYGGMLTNTINGVDVLDKGIFAITYDCASQAIEQSTGNVVMVHDTLLLVVGPTYSVFLNPELTEKTAAYYKRNRARSKKITIPSSMSPVPYDSIKDLIEEATDYEETDFGRLEQIYKNRMLFQVNNCHVFGSYIFASQDISEFKQWAMEEGENEILGHICRKASISFGGRDYVAWYAMDIPVNDGPWKLMGLPGLILKAETDDGAFAYEAIGIGNCNDTFIVSDPSLKESGLKDFIDIAEKHRNSIGLVFIHKGRQYISSKSPFSYTKQETVKR